MADIIDDIIRREGGYSNNPADAGGRTDKGISERAHPEAWTDGKVTDAEARAIYEAKYLKGPKLDLIKDKQLMTQMVDFAVTSGPQLAIMRLQEILHVTVDGTMGPETLAAINTMHPDDLNNSLVVTRMKMICKLVQKNPSQLQFLSGWANRILSFLK